MRKIKTLALLTAIGMISTGVCACGGGKAAKESSTKPASSKPAVSSTASNKQTAPAASTPKETDKPASTAPAAPAASSVAPAASSVAPETASTAPEAGSTASFTKSEKAEKLKAIFTIGYAGQNEQGDLIYWTLDAKATNGMFLLIPADGSEKVSFVGPIESEEGSDDLTITDDVSGNKTTLKTEQVKDKDGDPQLKITTESGNEAFLLPAPADQVVDAILDAGI